jgi:deazaflavin-dependent oxidoreductase (nitroreductase family)
MSSVEERLGAEPYCYLTTTGRKTGQPREIEIWFAAVGDTLYLMNGGSRRPPGSSNWVRNAQADPKVRVRIGSESFIGEARVVPFDSQEHDQARDLLVAKYATKDNHLAGWRATAFPMAIHLRRA